jgi:hypothetical protein
MGAPCGMVEPGGMGVPGGKGEPSGTCESLLKDSVIEKWFLSLGASSAG